MISQYSFLAAKSYADSDSVLIHIRRDTTKVINNFILSPFLIVVSIHFGGHMIIEARHEKICLRDLRPDKTQTGLLSYTD